MTRIIFFLLAILLASCQSARAADKIGLVPGQVYVEFLSKNNVNLYALQAQKMDILNELSRYITIELFSQNQLDNQVSIELKQQSLDSVVSRLLGDQNYIVRYTPKKTGKFKDSIFRQNIIQPGSIVNTADPISPGNDTQRTKHTSTYNSNTLIEAIEDYGDFKNPDSIKHLVKLSNFESSHQLQALTETLGDIGTDEAVNQLAQLMNHSSTEVREAVIYALGDIGSTAAVKVLGNAINDEKTKLRDLVISELALINNNQSVLRLMKKFNQQTPDLQKKLLTAISETSTPLSKAYLWEVVKNDNPQISVYAYDLLSNNLQRATLQN